MGWVTNGFSGVDVSYAFGLKLSKLAQRLARLKGVVAATGPSRRPAAGAVSFDHNLSLHSAPAVARVGYLCRGAMVAVGTAPIPAARDGRPVFPAFRAARFFRFSRHALVTR